MNLELKAKRIEERLDNYLHNQWQTNQELRREQYGDRKGFYATDMGQCFRKVAYAFYKVPAVPLNSRTIRILQNGEKVEERIEEYFKSMGALVSSQLRYDTSEDIDVPFYMSGRLDMIIDLSKILTIPAEKQDLAILEIKSINTFGFRNVAKNLTANTDHLYQITFYMWKTGIHQGIIVYEDKNTQEICFVPVEYDSRMLFGSQDGRQKGMFVEMTELAEQIENKEIPKRISTDKSKFPCSWKSGNCKYYDFCWNEHDGLILPEVEKAPTDSANDTDDNIKTAIMNSGLSRGDQEKILQIIAGEAPQEEEKIEKKPTTKTKQKKSFICSNCKNENSYKHLYKGGKKCAVCGEHNTLT